MSNFFKPFPLVNYNFGDNEQSVLFQHLGTYVDIIDQIKSVPSFYRKYYIQEDERPDTLSNKLYGTPNYAWSFFLMNDNLRISGWPVNSLKLFELSEQYYPGTTFTTDGKIDILDGSSAEIFFSESTTFVVGAEVFFPITETTATITKIDYDLGQIVTDIKTTLPSESIMITRQFNDINDTFTGLEALSIVSQVRQKDSVHHYLDAEGEYVYPSNSSVFPYALDFSSIASSATETYFERLQKLNEEQRQIIVLKPDAMEKVASDFARLMRQ